MSARLGTFASFSIFNYRLFFAGSLISNVGGWMARVALDWLVLTELTHNSAAALGLATALQFLPVPFLTPFAGSLADRLDKRKMLLVTQVTLGVNSLILWALVASGTVQLWHVYVLALLQGVSAAFDMPARQAFVSEMVPASHIPNAVGLNSAAFNGARLIGPGLAGVAIGLWGTAPALLVNAITFAATIVAVVLMRPAELITIEHNRARGGVLAGLRYVRTKPEIMLMLVIVFSMSTFGMNFPITNALMATREFGKGATQYGILGSVMAIGTLGAALLAARRARPRLRLLLGALGAFALCNLVSGAAPNFLTFLLLLIPTGLAQLTVMTACNATVQLAADPEFRGRALAVYMAVMMAGNPIGSPIIGAIGDRFGARATLYFSGGVMALCFLAITIFLMLHDGVRVRLRSGWPPRLTVLHGQSSDDLPPVLRRIVPDSSSAA